jgi:hypothetical protein
MTAGKVQIHNGKVLIANGKIATDCCCAACVDAERSCTGLSDIFDRDLLLDGPDWTGHECGDVPGSPCNCGILSVPKVLVYDIPSGTWIYDDPGWCGDIYRVGEFGDGCHTHSSAGYRAVASLTCPDQDTCRWTVVVTIYLGSWPSSTTADGTYWDDFGVVTSWELPLKSSGFTGWGSPSFCCRPCELANADPVDLSVI